MWSEAVDARENSVGTADAVPWPCDLTAYPLRRYGLTPLCAVAQYASYYAGGVVLAFPSRSQTSSVDVDVVVVVRRHRPNRRAHSS